MPAREADVGAGGASHRRVAVVGLGSVLMGDDAFGPRVVHQLAAGFTFPPAVELVDAGSPGLDLIPHVLGTDAIVFVDTVAVDAPPGTIRTYRKDEILAHPAVHPRVSPHEGGLRESLWLADAVGQGPADVLLVGVVPDGCDLHLGLSAPVAAACDGACAAVLAELERLGVPGAARPDARPLEVVWWERSPGAR